jgi:xanthine dehydrogenase accessory factor
MSTSTADLAQFDPTAMFDTVETYSTVAAAGHFDLPALMAIATWRRQGKRTCLVTLVNVEGSGPRMVGAQMAVSEAGDLVGYLTGGCLERELALVAHQCIRTGQPRLERYGRGSRYIDVRLPCGSAIDVLFDPGLRDDVIDEATRCLASRTPFELVTDVGDGSHVRRLGRASAMPEQGAIESGRFARLHLPPIRINVFGDGFGALQLAALLRGMGLACQLYSDDPATTHAGKASGLIVRPVGAFDPLRQDRWTAAAAIFHSHEKELRILPSLLRGPSFYVGAVGGRAAAAQRAQQLQDAGLTPDEIARLVAPAGLVRGARSATELALGIAAQILDTARAQRLVT